MARVAILGPQKTAERFSSVIAGPEGAPNRGTTAALAAGSTG
jgi:hypothetical protein